MPVDKLFANSNGTFGLRGLATYYLDNVTDQGLSNTLVLDTTGVNGGQGGDAEVDLPRQRLLRNAEFLDDRDGSRDQQRQVSGERHRVHDRLPGHDQRHRSIQTAEDNHLPGLFYTDFNVTQKVTIDERSWGSVLHQRDQRVQQEAAAAPGNRAGREQHLFGPARPSVPRRLPRRAEVSDPTLPSMRPSFDPGWTRAVSYLALAALMATARAGHSGGARLRRRRHEIHGPLPRRREARGDCGQQLLRRPRRPHGAGRACRRAGCRRARPRRCGDDLPLGIDHQDDDRDRDHAIARPRAARASTIRS